MAPENPEVTRTSLPRCAITAHFLQKTTPPEQPHKLQMYVLPHLVLPHADIEHIALHSTYHVNTPAC